MKRKEAFQRKNVDFLHERLYGRAEATLWYYHYTKEQLDYLWYHGYIKWFKPFIELGESATTEYITFTKVGHRWHNFYMRESMREYLYYYMFIPCKHFVMRYWHKLRIACGHHYAWQEYDNLTIDQI